MELEKRTITDLVLEALNIEGEIIELGAGRGRSIVKLAKFMKRNNLSKTIYACDTWKGLPYSDEGTGVKSALKMGQFNDFTINKFSMVCHNADIKNIVKVIQGTFEISLPEKLKDKKFCYAFLDADLYRSTFTGYKFLENRIVEGGIIAFHDYGNKLCPGVKKVVDETIDRNKFKEVLREGQSIFFKRIKEKPKTTKKTKEKKPV